MDEDLLTLISKIEANPSNQILNLDHPNISYHITALKQRFSNKGYSESDFVGAAILLQHYSLESFTNSELESLLRLNLSSLEHHTDVEYEPVMSNRLKGVMDTGSLRVYSVMSNKARISNNRVNYMRVRSYTAYQFLRSYLDKSNICNSCRK